MRSPKWFVLRAVTRLPVQQEPVLAALRLCCSRLTVDRVAALLGVSPRTIDNWLHDQRIPKRYRLFAIILLSHMTVRQADRAMRWRIAHTEMPKPVVDQAVNK
jgi:transcriptional regulator with XRE-family HTH domain